MIGPDFLVSNPSLFEVGILNDFSTRLKVGHTYKFGYDLTEEYKALNPNPQIVMKVEKSPSLFPANWTEVPNFLNPENPQVTILEKDMFGSKLWQIYRFSVSIFDPLIQEQPFLNYVIFFVVR